MKKIRWVILLSFLVVILMTFGCGTQTTQNSNKGTSQNQSKVETQPATKDTAQTQSKIETQPVTQDTAQTQSKVETQAASQAQTKVETQPAAQNNEPTPNKPSTPTVTNHPIVTITMASGDQIKVELYPDIAPNTVKSFISLVKLW